MELPAEAPLSEDTMRSIQADAYAGKSIEAIAKLMGDPKPSVARRNIIRALVKARAPLEVMVNVVRLARNRITRFKEMGGVVPTGKEGGYFLSTARNTVANARDQRWDIARMEAEEQVEHATRMRLALQDASEILPYHTERRSTYGKIATRSERRIRQAPDGADHTAYTSHTRINF